jgi:ABC-type sugar transport system permease subunit
MCLFGSIPVLIFAASFSWFADHEELPKKYKLFLMMLPFLVAVFLFSYLPLYGWSYAFFNYKFGMPMSEQEFVGFKWFTELITNQGHRDNIVRVMKNTFGMSGLGLVTSWMPMAFAIFLNEIGNGISLGLQGGGRKRRSRGGGGIDAERVIHEIFIKAARFDLGGG